MSSEKKNETTNKNKQTKVIKTTKNVLSNVISRDNNCKERKNDGKCKYLCCNGIILGNIYKI